MGIQGPRPRQSDRLLHLHAPVLHQPGITLEQLTILRDSISRRITRILPGQVSREILADFAPTMRNYPRRDSSTGNGGCPVHHWEVIPSDCFPCAEHRYS